MQIDVVGVRFRKGVTTYSFSPNGVNYKKGDMVIVETERGLQFGKVILPPFDIDDKTLKYPLKDVIRISTKKDYLEIPMEQMSGCFHNNTQKLDLYNLTKNEIAVLILL